MKKVAILWGAIGLIGIIFSIDAYINYSSGRFFVFMFSESFLLKNFFFGTISTIVGIGLFLNPKKQIQTIYSIPYWAIIFIIIGTIKDSIILDSFEHQYLWTVDYFYFLLSSFTLKTIQEEVDFDRINWKIFIQNNWLFILISGVCISCLIFLIAFLLPYDFFYQP